VSAAAAAHFANPRNDFWRLLHDAGFTPRLVDPQEQFEVPRYGIGLTNAAERTTKGSGDLRKADFGGSAARLEDRARLRLARYRLVGKGYRGASAAAGARPAAAEPEGALRPALDLTRERAVPYSERLRWFRALRAWVDEEPDGRRAVRALVVDERDRVLLLRWERPLGSSFWVTPGGGVEAGESDRQALLRELREEAGLTDPRPGKRLWRTEFVTPELALDGGWLRQRDDVYLVRTRADAVSVPDLVDERVVGHRWWTLDELDRSDDLFGPLDLPARVRAALSRASGS
jgi:8-oxo-dGTP pyrophosphatase MutT (NUDIX family)